MEGTLHALALLLVIFGSAALCYRYGKRPAAVAPAFVFTLVGVLVLCSIHPVSIFHGKPPWDNRLGMLLFTHQWPILACCLVLVFIFLPPLRWIRASSVVGFLLLLAAFTLHAARLYSLSEYDIRTVGQFLHRATVRETNPEVTPFWHIAFTGFDDDAGYQFYEVLGIHSAFSYPRAALSLIPSRSFSELEEIQFHALDDVNSYFPSIMLDLIPNIDWHGPVQGIGILSVIGLSLAMLIVFYRRIAPWRQWWWRLLYASVLFIAAGLMLWPLFPAAWQNYLFTPQWIIPAISISIIGAFLTASRKVLLPFIAFVYLLGMLLCLHLNWYEQEADRFETGWRYGSLDREIDQMRQVAELLKRKGDIVIIAGWLEDDAYRHISGDQYWQLTNENWTISFRKPQSGWYTPLTQLYRTTDELVAIWYPGGPLNEGLKKLEWRRYP